MTDFLFKSKSGLQFKGVTPSGRKDFHVARRDLGVSDLQVAEASSYSLAMVVRFALGLSATGGKVCAVVGDSLAGAVAATCVRHLVNAGAAGAILIVGEKPATGGALDTELHPLRKMGVYIEDYATGGKDNFKELVLSSHNVICGLFEAKVSEQELKEIATILNEAETPIHSVDAPIGINVESGEPAGTPLFSSSTLSIGAPLNGLNPARDCVGRHYLCDAAVTKEIYTKAGDDLTSLFAEQPVTQISPV